MDRFLSRCFIVLFPLLNLGLLGVGVWFFMGCVEMATWMQTHEMSKHLIAFLVLAIGGTAYTFSVVYDGILLYANFLKDFKSKNQPVKG